MSSFKLPPDPSTATITSYELWKKDANVWKQLTDVPIAKQGLALQYACRGNERIHEAVMAIDEDKVKCDDGFKNVIDTLDNLFKIDKKDAELKAYNEFETIYRKDGQTMADFILEFDRVLNKTKSHGNTMSENLLGLKLMRASNLTRTQQQMIKASTKEIKYTEVQDLMKRMFGETTGTSGASNNEIETSVTIKQEPIFKASHSENICTCGSVNKNQSHQHEEETDSDESEEEILFGYSKQRKQDKKFKRYQEGRTQETYQKQDRNFKKGKNPLDSQGKITKCNICESINHYANKCPDREDRYSKEERGKEGGYFQVTLFESDWDDVNGKDKVNELIFETIGAAIIDCGASKTVCGKNWLETYLELLTPEETDKVKYTPSSNVYKFGIGSCRAYTTARIPIVVGSKKVFLETDVVNEHLPLLVSKASLKRASAKLDTEKDIIQLLGEPIELINTQSGHYAIPLCTKKALLNTINNSQTQNKVTFISRMENMTKHDMATKLHRQFAHPPVDKLVKLIAQSEISDKDGLKEELEAVTEACEVCRRYKRPLPRPVVALPTSSSFNEVVALDIKFYHGTPLLHLIDSCTRFSATRVLRNKEAGVVIASIFEMWISIFGPPGMFVSDNGTEFANEKFRNMGEAFNIRVSTTAAESPWSNGVCERYNQVIGEMLDKIVEEVDCPLSVAVAWATNAKNSLHNVHGFSPAQLVFGYNPILPSVQHNKPPALASPDTYSEIISQNLIAMKKAREAFIHSESSERIRRALNHNTRTYSNVKYITGDKVYFKRSDENRWHGPATVIGQEGQYVLLRNQSSWIRVHPCRLQLIEQTETDICKNKDTLETVADLSHSDDERDDRDPETKNEENKALNSNASLIEVETANTSEPTTVEITSEEDGMEPENNSVSIIQKDASSLEEFSAKTTELDKSTHLKRTDKKKNKNTQKKELLFKDILKPGIEICFKPKEQREWIEGTLIGKYGKASGKTPNGWNVMVDQKIEYIDFDKEISEVTVKNKLIEPEPASSDIEVTKLIESEPASSDIEEIYTSLEFTSQLDTQISEAKNRELKVWKDKSVYEEVENDNFDLISLKWVVKPKIIEGVHSVKARLVARGCQELVDVRRDSPVCTKDSIRLALLIMTTKKWSLCSLDIKSAFLNNSNPNRDIYVKPPKEAGTKRVWLLKKTIYGLHDASRAWYLRLHKELIELGFSVSNIDPALFFYFKDNILHGILALYVDDLLYSGEQYVQNRVKELNDKFTIGCYQQGAFKYVGSDLIQAPDKSITIDQNSYIKNLKSIPIENFDLSLDTPIPEELKESLRSLSGQLNWAASVSRPDVSYQACQISTVVNNATMRDIHNANKAVRYLINNPVNILVPCFSSLEDLYLEIYADAALGNLPDGASQGGYVILVTDGFRHVPVSWSSHKLKRVARSTLTAETLAMVDAIDDGIHFATKLAEAVSISQKPLKIVCFTDSHSLCDAAHTSNIVGEKRLKIELGVIRECIKNGKIELRWVDTKGQLADSLTKFGASTCFLRQVMRRASIN